MNCNKLWNCEKCGKDFKRKYDLRRHVGTIHSNVENSFTCETCKKTFHRKSNIANHVRTHIVEKRHFECATCHRICGRRHDLIKHIHRKHRDYFDNGQNNLVSQGITERRHFECATCHRICGRKQDLIKHIRRKHSDYSENGYPYDCNHPSENLSLKQSSLRCIRKKKPWMCLKCGTTLPSPETTQEHYKQVHKLQLQYEHLDFSSFEEFVSFKPPEFALRTWWKTSVDIVKKFYCHRSGVYEDSCKKRGQKRKRHLKQIGSKKLQGLCPAQIIVRQKRSDGTCSVSYQKLHVGHSIGDLEELRHLYINREDKLKIAAKLEDGVPEAILQKMYAEGDQKKNRLDVLNCQDIRSVETSYGLTDPFRINNDSTYVNSFVSQHEDSVLYYKQQNHSDIRFGVFEEEDFVLVIQDEFQRKCLQQYGHKIVAFDGTHGMNSYNFLVHSILVMDTQNEGIPVAFLISNRSDQAVIDIFVRCIKDRVGVIETKTLMTDMDLVFYKSWISIMKSPQFSLYCTWHVRRRWRTELDKITVSGQTHKVNNEIRRRVIRDLISKLDDLLHESEEGSFIQKLTAFLSIEDPLAQSFIDYFRKNYTNNTTFWAYCYRLNAGVSCNMNIESFHRVLKYKIAKRKEIKTLAGGLRCIEQYIQYRNFKQCRKTVQPEISKKLRKLRKRHQIADEYSEKEQVIIEPIDNQSWQIASLDSAIEGVLEMYLVTKIEEKECFSEKCGLACEPCGSCFHEYQCSCFDCAIQSNMCEHIHALCIFLRHKTAEPETESTTQFEIPITSLEVPIVSSSSPEISASMPTAIISVQESDKDEQMNLTALHDEVRKTFEEATNEIISCLNHENDREKWYYLKHHYIKPMKPVLVSLKDSYGAESMSPFPTDSGSGR